VQAKHLARSTVGVLAAAREHDGQAGVLVWTHARMLLKGIEQPHHMVELLQVHVLPHKHVERRQL
jgi:hypothetical protein